MKIRGIASAVLAAGLLMGSAGIAQAVDGSQEVSCGILPGLGNTTLAWTVTP